MGEQVSARFFCAPTAPIFECATCKVPVFKPARGRVPVGPRCRLCREQDRMREKHERTAGPRSSCEICEKPTIRRGGRWCDDCRSAGRNLEAQRKWKDRPPEKRIRDNLCERPCKVCGQSFKPLTVNSCYCPSRRCKKSIAWAQRNAARKMRGGRIEPVIVYRVLHRDGWKCRICKRKTPSALRGSTKPNAPELDHILPLSRGGDHSERNLQCLCRSCNQRKSDRPFGQLWLI